MTRSEAIVKLLQACGPMDGDEVLAVLGGDQAEARGAMLRAIEAGHVVGVITRRCRWVRDRAQANRISLRTFAAASEVPA